MKSLIKILVFLAAISCSISAASQNADEIVSDYIQAIGGAEVVKGIKTMQMETTGKVLGFKLTSHITILNGRGFKTETMVMRNEQVACYTDRSGWTSSRGNKKVEDMPGEQYETGKNQIFIGWPFLDYKVRGYRAEFLGKENTGGVNAYKIRMVIPGNARYEYWFDPSTGYLIRSYYRTKMEGKDVEVNQVYSDYQSVKGGYVMPMETETNMGGQFSVSTRVTNVTMDQPVPYSVFSKPR